MSTLVVTNSIRRRIFGVLFIDQSLSTAAVILGFTLTSIIAADLSGTDAAAGLPSTITLIARAAFAYPLGWLLDKLGRRLGLSIGFVIGVAGFIISAWAVINGSFAGFLAGAALVGGSRASSEQSRYIGAEIFPVKQQAKVIGWIVFGGTLGSILGPLLVEPSSSLAEQYGLPAYAGPFLAAALMLLITAIISYILLRPDPQRLGKIVAAEEENGEDGSNEDEAERPLRQIFSNPFVLLAVAAMTIGQMVMVMLMIITPLHMSHNEHGVQAISFVIMAHTLGMFGLSGLTGWLIGKAGRLTMMIAGSLVLVSACLLAPVSTTIPILALALFLLGLGWNFAFVAGSSLLTDGLISAERGRVQGAGEMAVAVGAGLGSLGSGLIFARGGILAVSIVGLGFSLALLVMVLWMRINRRPVQLYAAGQD